MDAPRSPASGRIMSQSPNIRHNLFSDGSVEALWLAGLLAADGCVLSNESGWSLSQSGEHGRELMQTVCGLIGRDLPPTRQETAGADTHAITICSRQMVSDLRDNFAITPRKTLTLGWPNLVGPDAAAFLRGYVDGDGCVGHYRVGGGNAEMLHISFVGTQAFTAGAVAQIPVCGLLTSITRCENLHDARWNGRNAWDFGEWLYQHGDALPLSSKASKYLQYVNTCESDAPRWLTVRRKREQFGELAKEGLEASAIAERLGVSNRTVRRWLSSQSACLANGAASRESS